MSKAVDRLFELLGITRMPVVKAYDGYGDADDVIVHGHILKRSPLPRKKYRQNFWLNLFGLIRLFIVSPVPKARVLITWNGETKETFTDLEGFFKLEWKPLNSLSPGWQEATVAYVSPAPASVELAKSTCSVFVPHEYQYAFISDIDDTFLISHSSQLLKRLYVLFTKNAHSRRAFEGVANHYRLLAYASAVTDKANPFFYVSSSEWNLYDYIREFCRKQELPRGVFLLDRLKKVRDLLKTGQGKHATKYIRIARILKSYETRKYVLLGDNSQEDPYIYEKIVKDFPGMIHAVYIRNINRFKVQRTKEAVKRMEESGVYCCFFERSSDAIAHSKSIGLIKTDV
jgi:phosphatidate phosphatase APP1